MTATCTNCDSTHTQACVQCHSTRYCSPECSQTDWPSHSLLCSQYSTHTDRPNPSYKRAILFPPDEVKPKLIWVECKTEEDDEVPGFTYELCQIREHLGGNLGKYGAFPEYRPIQRNALLDRNLTNTLNVICRSTFLSDGSSVNKSVVKATQGAPGHEWRGPILAMKKRGLGTDPGFFLDINMQDYRDVVDYFISYRSLELEDDVRGRDRNHDQEVKKVRGVKIHCEGDQREYGFAKFAAVDVPVGHPVFSKAIVPISRLISMPLHTWQYPPDQVWRNKPNAHTNVPATVLHHNTDEDSGDWWGRVPTKWQDDVGSVLVVRRDGRDLSVQRMEALCYFCQFKVQPLLENAQGSGLVQMSRAEVMGYLTRKGFAEYFRETKLRKISEGEGGGRGRSGI